jgi:hypothetical protein
MNTSAPARFGRKAALHYHQILGIWPHEAAGLRALRKPNGARGFGRLVGVYNSAEAYLDTDGGPWTAVCEIHSMTCAADTLAEAMDFAARSEDWCEECERAGVVTDDQMQEIIAVAVLIAGGAPKRQHATSYAAQVPWSRVNLLRNALDDAGIHWRPS